MKSCCDRFWRKLLQKRPEEKLVDWPEVRAKYLTTEKLFTFSYIIILSAICWYNVGYIIYKFFHMDTNISLSNESPSNTSFPAITICAPGIFTPKKLAEMYPEFGRILRNFEYYHNKVEDDQAQNEVTRRRIYRYFESKALDNYTAFEVIMTQSVQPQEMFNSCRFLPSTQRETYHSYDPFNITAYKCEALRSHVPSIYEGRKCFTFFSELGDLMVNADKRLVPDLDFAKLTSQDCGNDRAKCSVKKLLSRPDVQRRLRSYFASKTITQMWYDLNPAIQIDVKLLDSLWAYLGPIDSTFKVAVHPPNTLFNRRQHRFFHVKSTMNHEVFFTRTTVLRDTLTPFYGGKCQWYRGGSFRNKDECQNVCIKRKSYAAANCSNYFNMLTVQRMFEQKYADKNEDVSSEKICPHHLQNYTIYLLSKEECDNHCSEECVEEQYQMINRVNSYYSGCIYKSILDDDLDHDLKKLKISDNLSNQTSDFIRASSALEPSILVHLDRLGVGKQRKIDIKSPVDSIEEIDDQANDGELNSPVNLRNLPQTYPDFVANVSDRCTQQIIVRIASTPFQKMTHQAAMCYEEFIGIIGGHIGIWLGLSLFKFLSKFIQTVRTFFSRLCFEDSTTGYTLRH